MRTVAPIAYLQETLLAQCAKVMPGMLSVKLLMSKRFYLGPVQLEWNRLLDNASADHFEEATAEKVGVAKRNKQRGYAKPCAISSVLSVR